MRRKILIAYGTRYGNTKEISQEIAKTLKEKGLEPLLYNLGVGKTKYWPNLDDFDGIIIGTSLKVNAWKKEVKNYLKKYKKQLKDKKFGIFTCGAYAIGAPKEAYEDIPNRLDENFELTADIYDAFGGVMDFSEDSNIGRTGKSILKLVAMGFTKEFNMEFDMQGANDCRDWDKIRSFAENFAEKL
jgi:menaquinone-dependent protoporphyrinogen IX oxidase